MGHRNGETRAPILSSETNAPWVADAVQALCEKSLLRRIDTGEALRFSMYESIREYTDEKARELDVHEGAAERHVEYYLQICGEAADKVYTHGGIARLKALETERDNLVSAHARSLETGLRARQRGMHRKYLEELVRKHNLKDHMKQPD